MKKNFFRVETRVIRDDQFMTKEYVILEIKFIASFVANDFPAYMNK